LWGAVEADPTTPVTVDLVEREVRYADVVEPFEIDDYTRWRLMEGLDDIGLTLRHAEDVEKFEKTRPGWKPVTLPAAG
jgi:3-isopropylmalate/(R)-2-methylmalate dehydratase small subunit